jgi:hypothetical protein
MAADSPIVEEVRRRATELSQQFDHDLQKYARHLREAEGRYQSRLVDQITVVRSKRLDKAAGHNAEPAEGPDPGGPSA